MNVGIGTVQFGQKYGVSNAFGQVSRVEVENILDYAFYHGCRIIDTAPVYGNAEEVLGVALNGVKDFHIVTKLSSNSIEHSEINLGKAKGEFYVSLDSLKFGHVYGLLLHSPSLLFKKNTEELIYCLKEFKDKGLVKKIGVSVYNPDEVEKALEYFTPDIIQFPINVFDHRFKTDCLINKMKGLNIELHARSVFLQGLMLMDESDIPLYLSKYRNFITAYFEYLKNNKMSKLEGALSFVKSIEEIDNIIVGVQSRSQLASILDVLQSAKLVKELNQFKNDEQDLINPINWKI